MNLGKDGQIPEDFRRKKPIKVTKMTVLGKSRHEVYFSIATKIAEDHTHIIIRIAEEFTEEAVGYEGIFPVENRAVITGFIHGVAFALEGIISGKINIKDIKPV